MRSVCVGSLVVLVGFGSSVSVLAVVFVTEWLCRTWNEMQSREDVSVCVCVCWAVCHRVFGKVLICVRKCRPEHFRRRFAVVANTNARWLSSPTLLPFVGTSVYVGVALDAQEVQ